MSGQALRGHHGFSILLCDGRHWGILSLGLAQSDFSSNRITVATVWEEMQGCGKRCRGKGRRKRDSRGGTVIQGRVDGGLHERRRYKRLLCRESEQVHIRKQGAEWTENVPMGTSNSLLPRRKLWHAMESLQGACD